MPEQREGGQGLGDDAGGHDHRRRPSSSRRCRSSSFSPAAGPAGKAVKIKGVGFTRSSSVSFDGVPAASVSSSPRRNSRRSCRRARPPGRSPSPTRRRRWAPSAAPPASRRTSSPEIALLIAELGSDPLDRPPRLPDPLDGRSSRWPRRLYAIPTWTRTVALVREHACRSQPCSAAKAIPRAYTPATASPPSSARAQGLLERLHRHGARRASGAEPSAWAGHRHRRLRPARLRQRPAVRLQGRARTRPTRSYSDPDASWGHRSAVSTRKGGGFYGYKLHAGRVTPQPACRSRGRSSTAQGTLRSSVLAPLLDKLTVPRLRPRDLRARQGLRQRAGLRRLRGARHCCPFIPLRADDRASSAASTSRRAASTARGRSPEPTTSGGAPSGAARPASASPRPCGSRPTGCTR